MDVTTNKRLFYGSCFALITTALSFSIRAGILDGIGEELVLDAKQLGYINSMWFLGFPLSMVVGGLLYYKVGGKLIMNFAFFAHLLGLLLSIFTTSYFQLLFATLLIGIGNGCTEAACNPMIADAFKGKKMNVMLNRFHMWFPGGIVIGSLLTKFMSDFGVNWRVQTAVVLVPALIYALLFLGQKFPKAKLEETMSISENFKNMLSPLFLFMLLCMMLTAISEFGPQQWTGLILSESGAHPMLVLASVTGVMAVARYFAGDIVNRFNGPVVLLASAILAVIGIYLLSSQTGYVLYLAAIVYALGIAFFWPNMLGFVADRLPKTGAIGLSLVGAMGMFSTSILQPIIGGWLDGATRMYEKMGYSGVNLELMSGQSTLLKIMYFPMILIVLFLILIIWDRKMVARNT